MLYNGVNGWYVYGGMWSEWAIDGVALLYNEWRKGERERWREYGKVRNED